MLWEKSRLNEWYKQKSAVRLVLSFIFVLSAFIWMAIFFWYVSYTYPHTTPDKVVVWVGIVTTFFLFFMGFYVGFRIQTKKAFVAFLILFLWSVGLMYIPIPEGYGEEILGGYTLLFMLIIILYGKYEQSKEKARPREEIAEK